MLLYMSCYMWYLSIKCRSNVWSNTHTHNVTSCGATYTTPLTCCLPLRTSHIPLSKALSHISRPIKMGLTESVTFASISPLPVYLSKKTRGTVIDGPCHRPYFPVTMFVTTWKIDLFALSDIQRTSRCLHPVTRKRHDRDAVNDIGFALNKVESQLLKVDVTKITRASLPLQEASQRMTSTSRVLELGQEWYVSNCIARNYGFQLEQYTAPLTSIAACCARARGHCTRFLSCLIRQLIMHIGRNFEMHIWITIT